MMILLPYDQLIPYRLQTTPSRAVYSIMHLCITTTTALRFHHRAVVVVTLYSPARSALTITYIIGEGGGVKCYCRMCLSFGKHEVRI